MTRAGFALTQRISNLQNGTDQDLMNQLSAAQQVELDTIARQLFAACESAESPPVSAR